MPGLRLERPRSLSGKPPIQPIGTKRMDPDLRSRVSQCIPEAAREKIRRLACVFLMYEFTDTEIVADLKRFWFKIYDDTVGAGVNPRVAAETADLAVGLVKEEYDRIRPIGKSSLVRH